MGPLKIGFYTSIFIQCPKHSKRHIVSWDDTSTCILIMVWIVGMGKGKETNRQAVAKQYEGETG